jgi:LTXXQ motif family protein
MLKRVIVLSTAIFIAGTAVASAQDAARPAPSQTNLNIVTDARLGIVKAVLQLTPEQAKFWPAVEEAVHARADARFRRIAAFGALAEKASQQREIDPIELLRGRADALAQKAAGLKKLVDAWQPLYQSLNPDQKERMRLLAMRVLRQLKDGVDPRRMEMYDEEDDEG